MGHEGTRRRREWNTHPVFLEDNPIDGSSPEWRDVEGGGHDGPMETMKSRVNQRSGAISWDVSRIK
jgi:hypothetical protein